MATYNGWTDKREYRVWMADDVYSVVSVVEHTNGTVRVFVDGDVSYSTSSLADAYRHAQSRMETLAMVAQEECECEETAEECGYVYNAPHAVHVQIVDEETNRTLDPWEL